MIMRSATHALKKHKSTQPFLNLERLFLLSTQNQRVFFQ